MPKNHIRVIKVPLPQAPHPKAPVYQRMPRMYLELIENKEKILPSLLNKEFVSDISKLPQNYNTAQSLNHNYTHARKYNQPSIHSVQPDWNVPVQQHKQTNSSDTQLNSKRKHKEKLRKDSSDSSAQSYYSDSDSNEGAKIQQNKTGSGSDYDSSDSDRSKSTRSESAYTDTTDSDIHHSVDVSNRLKELLDDRSDSDHGRTASLSSSASSSSSVSSISSGSSATLGNSEEQYKQSPVFQRADPPPPGMIQPGMIQPGMIQPGMLQPGMIQPGINTSQTIFNQQDQNYGDHTNGLGAAPTLSELRGSYQHPPQMVDAGQLEADQQDEEDKKREILFKFDLLKKSYKETDVPDFTIHTDYKTLQQTYDNTIKGLSVDNTVESYKTYLIGGFMAVEYFLGSFLKFDMKGFTQHQILNMSNYQRLLIELGEKSYVPTDSDWPVEVRLLIMILIQAAVFVLGKVIMNKTGSNVLSMFNSLGSMGGGGSEKSAPKRKMKGPEIDFDDIPDN